MRQGAYWQVFLGSRNEGVGRVREKEDNAIKGASLSLLLFTSPQNGSLECLSACSHPPLVGDCPRGVNSPKGVGSAGSKALEKNLRQRERERCSCSTWDTAGVHRTSPPTAAEVRDRSKGRSACHCVTLTRHVPCAQIC